MPWDEVMSKFKLGSLHSGSKSGPKITNRKQAIAVMLSEKRKAQGGKSEYASKGKSGRRSTVSSSAPSGALSHRPRVFKNPPTLGQRRTLSHSQYGNSGKAEDY